MREVVGRPPGDPTARWTSAADSRPTAMAATAPLHRDAPKMPERRAEVRRRGGGKGGGDGKRTGRERWRPIEVGDPGDDTAGLVGDNRGNDERERDRSPRAREEITGQGSAAPSYCGNNEHQRPPDRGPRRDAPQRFEQAWERLQQLGEFQIELPADLREHRAHDDEYQADQSQGDIGRSSSARFILGGREQEHASGGAWHGGGGGARGGAPPAGGGGPRCYPPPGLRPP